LKKSSDFFIDLGWVGDAMGNFFAKDFPIAIPQSIGGLPGGFLREV
jgi:hypothetical protein